MPADKAWVSGPYIGINRSRQSLSETEHGLITALLAPDQLAAQRIIAMRDVMLEFVTAYIASDIFEELKQQFWFDETFVSKDMVAERCLSFMILGPTAIAAE
jgi:hypothetical protein